MNFPSGLRVGGGGAKGVSRVEGWEVGDQETRASKDGVDLGQGCLPKAFAEVNQGCLFKTRSVVLLPLLHGMCEVSTATRLPGRIATREASPQPCTMCSLGAYINQDTYGF